jgi:serine/threonine protein kinase
MANVYYAEHQLLERPLVIKVLHAHLSRDAEMRERFRREAESASQLVHPHICTIIDYAEAAEAVFIVMPYLAGGSLADVLVKERTVAAGPAAAVCAQIATALDYAHRRGVVHRDVKPDNVLFDEDGHALITDFGIATARFHGRLTGTGRAMGTPHYMSPEQARGESEIGGASDQFSTAMVLYELVSARRSTAQTPTPWATTTSRDRGDPRCRGLEGTAGALGARYAVSVQTGRRALPDRLGPRRRPAVVPHDGRGIRRAALGLVCPTRGRSPRNARLIRFATPT